MPTLVKYKPAKHSTLVWLSVLVIISLLLNAAIIFVLLQLRTASKTILLQTAADLDTLAAESFQYTVEINQTVPVATEVVIDEEVLVPVSMVVSHTIAIDTEVPFQDEITVPLDLMKPGETIPISTTLPFEQVITVPIKLNVADILPIALPSTLGQQLEIPLALETGQVLPINSRMLLDRNTVVPLNLALEQDFLAETTLFGQVISIPVNLDLQRVVSASATLIPNRVEVPLNFLIGRGAAGRHRHSTGAGRNPHHRAIGHYYHSHRRRYCGRTARLAARRIA